MKHDLEKVSTEVRKYVEAKVLPRYNELPGHTGDHINYVIRRALKFAEEVPNIDYDMVYIIAAYHDLGRLIDNETHNIESAKMLLEDDFIKKLYSKKQRMIMAEAIEDHRASLKGEPRNIYGKIVSSADRNTNIHQAVKRSFSYNRVLNPSKTVNETIEDTRIHLREKFGRGGYATKKMYFKDEEYEKYLDEMEIITKNPISYRAIAMDFLEGQL